jgi:ectoine hydroxylase
VIVRQLPDLRGTSREVSADNWTSRRLLLAADRMGFSLHDTLIHAGTETRMCYRNHLEAVYCVAGRGSIEVLATGEVHPISDGTMYALDQHDEHILRAETELRMICVFDPPLVGSEVHDATGAYPSASEASAGGAPDASAVSAPRASAVAAASSAAYDPYHSRVAGTWSFAERLDPVVHGSLAGPLSAEELRTYEQRGYLVKHALFSEAEVAAILAEAEELARPGAALREQVIVDEPGGGTVRSVFRVHRSEGLLGWVSRDARFVDIARQLLGSSVYIHQSRINFKPAFEGKPFPWHSDFETWHCEDGMPAMRALSASLLLTPNSEHNGPLLVIPSSHRRYVRCVGETPEEHFKQSLRKQQYGVPDPDALKVLVREGAIESVTGPAGSVVFFDCNLMHGSGVNLTPLPRHNLFIVYNSTENGLGQPTCGRPPRPLFLAERDFAPVDR